MNNPKRTPPFHTPYKLPLWSPFLPIQPRNHPPSHSSLPPLAINRLGSEIVHFVVIVLLLRWPWIGGDSKSAAGETDRCNSSLSSTVNGFHHIFTTFSPRPSRPSLYRRRNMTRTKNDELTFLPDLYQTALWGIFRFVVVQSTRKLEPVGLWAASGSGATAGIGITASLTAFCSKRRPDSADTLQSNECSP